MVYKWKEASRIKTDPMVAAGVLNDLAEKDALNAETLVEVSRPESAPLHGEFEWDDNKAASSWRKHQARNIINALVIVPDDSMTISEPVRAYFQVSETKSAYTSTIALISRPDTRELLLRSAMNELAAFQSKYNSLVELTEVFNAIEMLREKEN